VPRSISAIANILVDSIRHELAQYMIVRRLSIDYPNLSVTGDPDQSIYGGAGRTEQYSRL